MVLVCSDTVRASVALVGFIGGVFFSRKEKMDFPPRDTSQKSAAQGNLNNNSRDKLKSKTESESSRGSVGAVCSDVFFVCACSTGGTASVVVTALVWRGIISDAEGVIFCLNAPVKGKSVYILF